MTDDGRQHAPRETAAGLERDGKPPRPTRSGASKANPASQSNLTDDRSSPDQQDPRTKSQTGKHMTADKWNGRDRQSHR
jgi:hypothetical protein